jgi:predicted  nucleic acid-binding Zn-ribbon protein
VNAALACQNCSWFGVYRTDVAESLAGCPNCGGDALVLRDLEDERWGKLGHELLRELDPAAADPLASPPPLP